MSRSIAFPGLALAVIFGLFWIFKPAATLVPTQRATKSYSYTLQNKTLTSGVSLIQVTDGDKVEISVTADQDWPEFHIHGYELTGSIKANTPTSITFTADKTGSFEVEVHFNDTDDLKITTLAVQPKI